VAPADPLNLDGLLGTALYRVGEYQEAMEAHQRYNVAYLEEHGHADPTSLGYIAMSHQRLGHEQEARAALAQMEALLEGKKLSEASRAFYDEVEEVVTGPSSSS
jgi:hypothetical protein